MLETKNIATEVRVDGDTLLAYRSDGPCRYSTTGPARQARGNAALSRELTEAGVRCRVQVVVVVWGDFPQRVASGDRVTTVHGAHLAAWLEQQTPVLDRDRVSSAQAVLTSPSTTRT